MAISRDRLLMVRELYEESLTFRTNYDGLPKTVIGQCIVSYRRFVEYLLNNYGIDIFFDIVDMDLSIKLKNKYNDKNEHGIKIKCNIMKSAINIARKALSRSRHGSFEVTVSIESVEIPLPVIKYSVHVKKNRQKIKCKIFTFKDIKDEQIKTERD